MSLFEDIQESGQHHQISHQLQRLPCGRCNAAIEYEQGTHWNVVSKLANKHWDTCPGRPHVKEAPMLQTPTSPLDNPIEIPIPSPVASEQPRNSPDPIIIKAGIPQNNLWIPSEYERKRKTLQQRKSELEQDEYAMHITAKSVVCAGCHKEISLDKRSNYYPGLWLKHRGKCPGIKKLERAKSETSQSPSSTRQESLDIVTPTLSGSNDGDVLHLDPTEHNQSRSEIATHQLVHQHNSAGGSSEGASESVGSPLQEPFPELNAAFYWDERLESDEHDEWKYRYATKDEIATNLFRGQDEPLRPYERLGGRPKFCLQTGVRFETSHIKNRIEHPVSHPENFRSTEEANELGTNIESHIPPYVDQLLR